jgi:hypothetical protein
MHRHAPDTDDDDDNDDDDDDDDVCDKRCGRERASVAGGSEPTTMGAT